MPFFPVLRRLMPGLVACLALSMSGCAVRHPPRSTLPAAAAVPESQPPAVPAAAADSPVAVAAPQAAVATPGVPAALPAPAVVQAPPSSAAAAPRARRPAVAAGAAAPTTAGTAAPKVAAPATPAPPVTLPAPGAPRTAETASATLDLQSLERRLRDTRAIGVFTKLALKNQVDDLLTAFRGHHGSRGAPPLSQLRQRYDLLLLKVMALLQDGDPALARAVHTSREAIWGVLVDPVRFSKL